MILPLRHRPPTGPFAEPRPHMRGRYLLRDPKKWAAMVTLDAAFALAPVKKGPVPARPQRILLADWGHLGDVVTTFGAISILKERFPGVEIGMIVGNWGSAAIRNAGLVDRLHVIDHPLLNRSDQSRGEKLARYRETRRAQMPTIRAAGYEVGIDFYPFFPPAHPLFLQAGIPARLGYASGGFGSLLSGPADWPDADMPTAEHYRPLLDLLLGGEEPLAPGSLRPQRDRATLAPPPPELANGEPYIVLHPGSGAAYKDWGFDNWRILASSLVERRPTVRLVVTGAGKDEVAMADRLAAQVPEIANLAGRLDWEGFVRVIADAAQVICPDTATGHVAALFDVPTVSIFTGTNNAAQWAPYTANVKVLMQPTRCAPCNRPGCEAMACIRDVSPDDVYDALWTDATDDQR
mgnify:CR=1 FL=1